MTTNPIRKSKYKLEKQARRGFRGYPIATIAYYGPDDIRASKVAVGILLSEKDKEAVYLERWFSETGDVRHDLLINQQIVEFIEQHKPRSVAITARIIGCPHEEGIDYPLGEKCPQCPFWANRDRWTGEWIT
ncbi:MAG: hypothetical protein AUK02_05345 [Anaerolineae bacterium CG2_30_58_95]|nr:MAG: hypothetical protein AUK02_05345 [Anaerolineae bacterium CG2_30_58_95]